MSRNKREGRYAGCWQGKHTRTQETVGKKFKTLAPWGMYKLDTIPNSIVSWGILETKALFKDK